MKKFWAWLLLSSQDPTQASLTIKGILSAGVTYVIFFTGIFHLNVQASDLNQMINFIGLAVGGILMFISSVRGVYGIVRKIISTARGTNQVALTGKTL